MYRDRIGKVLQSRLAIHGNLDVRNLLKMGNAISKLPLVRKSSLDENLIEAGHKMGLYGEKQAVDALSGLRKTRMDVTAPFAENIREINRLYNKPVCYLMDKENIYIRQVQDT